MESNSLIPVDLINAFLNTNYHVEDANPFILRVGEKSQELKQLFKRYNHDSAVFLTAWNPFSELTDQNENLLRQVELESDIKNLDHPYLPGYGKDENGVWPPEPSIMILGMALETAKLLGKKYRQNALIWSTDDAIPQLILLR